MRKLIITSIVAGALAVPGTAAAHDLSCGNHRSEVNQRSVVAATAGSACVQKGRKWVRWSRAYGRYVIHQDVREVGGSYFFGLHVTIKLAASATWWTYYG